jgi:capsular polysaccharide biosynthesis protein
MKKILFLFLFLVGCRATPPSEAISNTVVNGLQSHVEAISLLEKQTTPECKTEAFIANLNALKTQTESMVGQVKSISQSCKVEKDVLYRDITIRNIVIGILAGILILIAFLFIRKRV